MKGPRFDPELRLKYPLAFSVKELAEKFAISTEEGEKYAENAQEIGLIVLKESEEEITMISEYSLLDLESTKQLAFHETVINQVKDLRKDDKSGSLWKVTREFEIVDAIFTLRLLFERRFHEGFPLAECRPEQLRALIQEMKNDIEKQEDPKNNESSGRPSFNDDGSIFSANSARSDGS